MYEQFKNRILICISNTRTLDAKIQFNIETRRDDHPVQVLAYVMPTQLPIPHRAGSGLSASSRRGQHVKAHNPALTLLKSTLNV